VGLQTFRMVQPLRRQPRGFLAEPLIDEQLTVIQERRFPQNTVNNATAR